MTMSYRIRSVFRNKRFILFTLIFPSACYLLFIYQFSSFIKLDTNMFAIYSAMFGVAGAGLNTFSMKVSKEKQYFMLMSHISKYTTSRFLLDSVITQTILNIFIIFVVTAIGLILGKITISLQYAANIVMLLYYGLYYILLGLILGLKFNNEELTSASMPLYFIFMLMNITPNAVSFKGFEFISIIQRIFPGYYFNDLLNQGMNANMILDISVIFIHLAILTSIAVLVFKSIRKCLS